MAELVILHDGGGEWSALYVDGKLERVGDHYLTEERAFELAGVRVEQTADFLRGGARREDVAQTLDEVAAYRQQRQETEAQAAGLYAQARELLEQAVLLDPGLKPAIEVGPKIGNKSTKRAH